MHAVAQDFAVPVAERQQPLRPGGLVIGYSSYLPEYRPDCEKS